MYGARQRDRSTLTGMSYFQNSNIFAPILYRYIIEVEYIHDSYVLPIDHFQVKKSKCEKSFYDHDATVPWWMMVRGRGFQRTISLCGYYYIIKMLPMWEDELYLNFCIKSYVALYLAAKIIGVFQRILCEIYPFTFPLLSYKSQRDN